MSNDIHKYLNVFEATLEVAQEESESSSDSDDAQFSHVN